MDLVWSLATGCGMAVGIWVVVEIWKEFLFERRMSKMDKGRRIVYWHRHRTVAPLFSYGSKRLDDGC